MLAALVLAGAIVSGAPDSQAIVLENVRFVSDSAVTTVLEPGTSLPAGLDGSIKAEFEFQSDLVNSSGAYYAAPMIALWTITDSNGDFVVSDGLSTVAGDEWQGVRWPVSVLVTELDVSNGVGRAALELPVRTHTPAGSRFPAIPAGGATFDVRIGWDRILVLGPNHEPAGELGHAGIAIDTHAPAVWVGTMDPPAQAGDAEILCLLILDAPTQAARTFQVTATPPDIVTVLSPSVEVAAGEFHATFLLRADDLGRCTLRAKEGGVLVAQSARLVVQPALVTAIGPNHYYTSPSLATAHDALKSLEGEELWFKECRKATIPEPSAHPTIERCMGCRSDPAAQTCAKEDQSDVILYNSGRCVFAFDSCTYITRDISSTAYQFASKRVAKCGSFTFGPLSVELYTTCCTYNRDPNGDQASVLGIVDCTD